MLKKIVLLCIILTSTFSASMWRLNSPIFKVATPSPDLDSAKNGGAYVIAGPMTCGKSDELMRIISVLRVAQSRILVCKNSLDTRAEGLLVSRRKTETPIEAHGITEPAEILALYCEKPVDYVTIDEVQFFKERPLMSVVQTLIKNGVYVIAAGLDKDFKGEPFGLSEAEPLCMPALIAIADECLKLKAVCTKCRAWNATMTQRLVDGNPARASDPLVVIDDGKQHAIEYQPRCRSCYELPE